MVELNPAHVAEQRRVMGRRRLKTDKIDVEAITELVLAGRGRVIGEREVLCWLLAAVLLDLMNQTPCKKGTVALPPSQPSSAVPS